MSAASVSKEESLDDFPTRWTGTRPKIWFYFISSGGDLLSTKKKANLQSSLARTLRSNWEISRVHPKPSAVPLLAGGWALLSGNQNHLRCLQMGTKGEIDASKITNYFCNCWLFFLFASVSWLGNDRSMSCQLKQSPLASSCKTLQRNTTQLCSRRESALQQHLGTQQVRHQLWSTTH